jgi:hypothetical protein
MKTIRLLFWLLLAAISARAETTMLSADARYLTELITDGTSRVLILAKMDPLPPGSAGLPERAEMRVWPHVRAPDENSAQTVVYEIHDQIKRVIYRASSVSDPALRLRVEKLLTIMSGLNSRGEMGPHRALYELVGLHQRKLSFELLSSQLAGYWDPVPVQLPDGRTEERHVIDQLTLIDLPAIADIFCRRLNEYNAYADFGPLTKAQRAENEPFVRYLCAALGIKYSVPFGGWTPGNLKSYAIKQLRRAAKRPGLVPTDAAAIATALHQLETFQPNPAPSLRL